jgi:hypothetical protein
MAVQETTTQTILPEWYTQYAQNVLSKAYAATNEPYQKYGGARIAGFAPEQEQAFGEYKSSMGEYKPYIGASTVALGAGTGSFTQPGVAQQYMNPYIQNVVSGIGAQAGRNLYENILPQVNRTFIGGGTFGGSRSAEFTQRAIRDAQAAALSAQNSALSEGYDKASELYSNEAGRYLEAAPLFASLGEQAQNQRINELKGLESIGLERQNLAQSSADLAYDDFERQRDYPLYQAQQLANIGGQPSPSGAGSTVTTAPGVSKTGQVIGALATGAGILNRTGAFGRGGWLSRLFKEGGHVTHGEQRGLGWLKD